MPYVLLIIGIVLVVSGVRGTHGDLGKLLQGDFSGNNSFVHWAVAILVIGALGYIQSLRTVSRAFLFLLLVALLLSKKNNATAQGVTFFNQFNKDFFGK